nr:putative reverse transcriptase domain-containing protein [Tanacetum cinerariifolium]
MPRLLPRRGPIGLESCATWDLDRVTWGGRDKGVGTVEVRWDVRECTVGVMGKKGENFCWVLLGVVMGFGEMAERVPRGDVGVAEPRWQPAGDDGVVGRWRPMRVVVFAVDRVVIWRVAASRIMERNGRDVCVVGARRDVGGGVWLLEVTAVRAWRWRGDVDDDGKGGDEMEVDMGWQTEMEADEGGGVCGGLGGDMARGSIEPYADDASPTTESLGYIAESNSTEKDTNEDPIDYPDDPKNGEEDDDDGSLPFPLPPTSPAYDQAPLSHRTAMIHIRDDIPKEDMLPRRRFIPTAPLLGCDVVESSAATARGPRGQYDFVDNVVAGQSLVRSPGHDAQTIARATDRAEDVGYARALHASEHRMMTSIEEVNLRISYQAQVYRQEIRDKRTAYETELQEVRQAYLSSEARNKALLARLETLLTGNKANVVVDALSKKEWSRPLWVRALVMTIDVRGMLRKDLPKEKLQPRADGRNSMFEQQELGTVLWVMLKNSPWKGVVCFRKRVKLNPRYIGPFKALSKVGDVAYSLELPQQLSQVHNTFHVSNLKKCLSDETLVIPLEELRVDDKLHFVEEPVEVMDREIKQLNRSRIPIIKLRWNSK